MDPQEIFHIEMLAIIFIDFFLVIFFYCQPWVTAQNAKILTYVRTL